MRFLLDGMLGKLTRWLRIIGHDALYLNDVDDVELVKRSLAENRILLTSDVALYKTSVARGAEAFLVRGRTEAERLANLAHRFKLELQVDTVESRCPTCGSPLTTTTKESVRGKVPATTFKAFTEFWICTNPECQKVYWQGSHWKNIDDVLARASRLLADKRRSGAGE